MRQRFSILSFSGFLILFFTLSVFAGQAGRLDLSFGTGGTVRHHLGSGNGYAVAVQSDGKIIVGGGTIGGIEKFILVRFNIDGTLDTGFGNGGEVRTQIFATNPREAAVRDLIIQPDGKIVAVGNAGRGSLIPPMEPIVMEVAVVRYNADGSLDTTFDTDGIATTLVNGDPSSFGFDGELQADGKIVVADNKFRILRFNSNGSLDTNFGMGGFVITTFGTAVTNAQDLKIQPDGKIVAVGGQGAVAMIRLNTDGSFDTTFDTDGKLVASIAGYDRGYGLVIQPDGKMVALAISQTSSSAPENLGLMRIMPNGTFDTTFGTGGKTVAPANFGTGLDIALQADGKIITAGIGSFVFSPPTSDFAVARFLPNGSPDTTFDGDGVAIINIMAEDTARAVVIQPNGKIVVGGQSTTGGEGIHLSATRVHGRADTVADFDGDGKTDISIFRPSNGQWWFLRSSDGGNYALQFGISTDKIVPADYTGDGKTDVAIYRPESGEWYILRSEDFSYYAFPFGISTDKPVPADYDGDGKADPAVFRGSTGTWYINESTTGNIQITNFGINGDRPVPADYDGDGKADIAVYRVCGGNCPWWIKRSSDNSVYAEITPTGLGFTLMPGDFTGDGKADYPYFFGANNGWYVLRSEDLSTTLVQFGQTGDILTPGDYDGDGKLDVATFRPSNNTWNIRRSSDGVTVQQTFGASGDIPTPNVFVVSFNGN